MKLGDKDWSCPKKQKARQETIISPYRETFDLSLPADRQYWTLCGQCSTDDRKPLVGCELWQMTDSDLIVASQFYGVEINPEIHAFNVAAFPGMNWYNDDFYHAMVSAQAKGQFNPGIVNCDLPRMPNGGGAAYVAKIMAFLTDCTKDVMFVSNFILKIRNHPVQDGEAIVSLLGGLPQFRRAMEEGNWSLVKTYSYEGTEKSARSWMGSLVFIKKDINYAGLSCRFH